MPDRPLKLLFFVENPTSFQHLVRSKLLQLLSEQQNYSCTVVLPPSLKPPEVDVQRLPGVVFRCLDFHSFRPKDLIGRVINKPLHIISRDLLTVYAPHATLSQDRLFQQKGISLRTRLAYASLLKRMGLGWWHLSRLAQKFGHYPEIAALLDEEQPDCVVYFNILIGQMDFLREVKRRGIPLILDIPNWDQATSKGPLTVLPDHVFVWSDTIKKDFCEIHHFPPERVHSIGVLQFDWYFQGNATLSREEFCRLHKINPASKIILYAYGIASGVDTRVPVINEILDIVRDNRLGFPCHLIFRASPRVPFPDELRHHPMVTFQHPLGEHSPDRLGWILAPGEDMMRMSTLAHSDVVVNVFSTMCLDALCMHKPVINLGYACGADEKLPNQMERFFKYSHVAPVAENDGTWIPKKRSEFEQALRETLAAPQSKKDSAEALLERICGPADGNSYRRWLAAFHTSMLDRKQV
ncbi:hypothetical protein [Prosthecobacter sp.]|uniref:hypothetical protein n=1 Tax=Prosthecobacter sp. TaxID=1965333 RepID=UPI001D211FE1|nr:hypothetical protein [Prosthecobacter sp.]MCB1275295.1 hypothetical protein [Prosthecobacter sp.]